MNCLWTRPGQYCPHAKDYVGGGPRCTINICEPIIEQCGTCKRQVEFGGIVVCASYPKPSAQWKINPTCAMATHIERVIDEQGRMLDPIKASKLMMGRKAGKKEKRKAVKKT